jgi:hypothetical protein
VTAGKAVEILEKYEAEMAALRAAAAAAKLAAE